MSLHEAHHEAAARNDFLSLSAQQLQRPCRQTQPDAPSTRPDGHLGVGQYAHAGGACVVDEGDATVELQLEAAGFPIVPDDICHALIAS
jgi:hypothetical protein